MADASDEPLLGVDPRRLRELRLPIGFAIAFAMGESTEAMASDDSVHPSELAAAMLDAHAIGLASAVRAAGRLGVSESREALLETLMRRVRSHLDGMPG